MPVGLLRAVSPEELADLRTTGRFRTGPSSCEGKHFATTVEDARRWGVALYRGGGFSVVHVTVGDVALQGFDRWDRLDMIGPALFARIELLDGAVIREVADEF